MSCHYYEQDGVNQNYFLDSSIKVALLLNKLSELILNINLNLLSSFKQFIFYNSNNITILSDI